MINDVVVSIAGAVGEGVCFAYLAHRYAADFHVKVFVGILGGKYNLREGMAEVEGHLSRSIRLGSCLYCVDEIILLSDIVCYSEVVDNGCAVVPIESVTCILMSEECHRPFRPVACAAFVDPLAAFILYGVSADVGLAVGEGPHLEGAGHVVVAVHVSGTCTGICNYVEGNLITIVIVTYQLVIRAGRHSEQSGCS